MSLMHAEHASTSYISTSMLHSGRNQLPVHNRRPEHLRDRVLVEHALLLALHRQADVDAAALGRRDLDVQAIL